MDLWKALRIVRQRKWIFLAATVAALLALGLTTDRSEAPVIYKSAAKVLLTPPSTPTAMMEGSSGASLRTWFADPALLKELLHSSELMDRVAHRLGLKSGNEIKGNVALEPMSESHGQVTLATISVRAATSKNAQKYAATVVEEFINYVEELSAREYAATRQYLEELVAEAHGKINEAETAILKWQEKNKAVNVDQAIAELSRREGELEAEQSKLQQQVAGLNYDLAQLRAFTSGQQASAPWAILNQDRESLSVLEKNVADQKLRLAELRQVFTDENAQVKEQAEKLRLSQEVYRREVASAVDSLVREKQGELQRAQSSLKAVQGALAAVHKQTEVGDERFRLARMQRDLAKWEDTYSTLTQKLYQARVQEQSSRRQGAISVLEAPGPGGREFVRVAPSALKRLVLGFPFCLVFGLTLVLVVEYLSSSMKMRPRIEETLELPVLASIPRIPSDLAAEWEEVKKGSLRELVAAGSAQGNGNGNGGYSHGANGNGNGRNGNGHYRNGNGNGRH